MSRDDEVDGLIRAQTELHDRIFSRASEKLDKTKLTLGVTKARLQALETSWNKFQTQHDKLLREAPESDYIKQDVYHQTETFFLQQKGMFLDMIRSFEEGTTFYYENNKRSLVREYLANFISLQKMRSESAVELRKIFTVIKETASSLDGIGRPISSSEDLFVYLAVELLDPYSRREWENSISETTDEPPSYETLERFLDGRMHILESMQPSVKTSDDQSSRPVISIIQSNNNIIDSIGTFDTSGEPNTVHQSTTVSNNRENSTSQSTSRNSRNVDNNIDNNAEIMCNCHEIAIQLTVKKETSNKGRLFYKCAKQQGCEFFLWAPDSAESRDNAASERSRRESINLDRNDDVNAGHVSGISGTSNNDRGNSSTNDTIVCQCNQPARKLTVQKDNHNKGRQFYGCPKGKNSTCEFFKWADENDIDNRGNTGNRTHSRIPQKGSNAPKKSRLAGGKRKCGNCGIEGHIKNRCPENPCPGGSRRSVDANIILSVQLQ